MEDIQKLCRVCAHDSRSRKASLINIFSSESLKKNIADKINCHLPIKVSKGDGMPQVVCQSCVNKLEICHMLINICVEANERIHHLINDSVKVEWKPKGDFEKVRNSIAPTKEKSPSKDTKEKADEEQEQLSATEHAKHVVEEAEDSDVWPEDNDNPDSPASAESVDEWIPEGADVTNADGIAEETTATASTAHSTITATAEITVVAVSVTPGNKDKNLDATSQLNFVSIDKSEYSNSKQRAKAAISAVSLISEAAKFSAPRVCSVCNRSSNVSPLIVELDRKSVDKCPQCSQPVDALDIFKQLSKQTDLSAKLFKDSPSKNVVTCIGNYNVESKLFTYINQSSENYTQVEVPRKSVLSESIISMFNQSAVPVRYLCGICDKHYPNSKDSFIGHIMETHFGVPNAFKNLAHACSICFKRLNSKSSLQRHMHVVHKEGEAKGIYCDNDSVVCDECGKMVLKRLISTHKMGHLRRECQYCHQILAYRTWTRHKRFQENPSAAIDKKISCTVRPSPAFSKALQFSCEYCHAVLERTPWAHHYAHRAVFGSNVPCPETILDPEQEKLDPKRQTVYSAMIKKAIAIWSKRRNEIKEQDYNYKKKKYYYPNKPMEKKPKMECPDCHMMLSEYTLNIHKLRHAGKFDLQCSYCEKKFIDKAMLRNHVKHVHLKIGPTCKYCNKYIAKRSKLLSHEALHRGERNFKCPYCPKLFPGMPNVYNHVKLVHERVVYPRENRSKKAPRPPPLEEPPVQNLVELVPQMGPLPQGLPLYFPL